MALAYIKPGVTVDEVIAPSFGSLTSEPTSICIIGPSQGYQEFTEVVTLVDNHPVTLGHTNPDTSTIVVTDASDPNADPFIIDNYQNDNTNHDYTVDDSDLSTTGLVTVARSMQTTIADDEVVTVYHYVAASESANNVSYGTTSEDMDVATDAEATLSGTTSVVPTGVTASTDSVIVQSQGVVDSANYAIVGDTIAWQSGILGKFQRVYVSYTSGGTDYVDQPYILDYTNPVSFDHASTTGHVVKNAIGATGTADTYTEAVTVTATEESDDYVLAGSGLTTNIARSKGTTSIGRNEDQLAVKITYRATPNDYFLPTKFFSQSDVEDKYGASFDSSGAILNSISYASALAFDNGATSVTVQALFLADTPNRILTTDEAEVDILQAWEDSLESIRVVDTINVLVPLASSGGFENLTDATVLAVWQRVRNHISYMAGNDQFMVAVCGEDSTISGLATLTTLRNHAVQLGAQTYSEAMCMIAPANFSAPNQNGVNIQVGGQYAAAAVAGMLAARPVQATLTRKQLTTINSVNEIRSEMDKNADASSGLMVIENKNGVVRVRHAITVDTSAIIKRELNVVRAKYHMVETIKDRLDSQAIGNIPADDRAAFTVQLMVESSLDEMVTDGVIVSFKNVQTRSFPNDPTQLEVRFSYLPSFPLNYISIKFSIDTTTGVIVSDQGQET